MPYYEFKEEDLFYNTIETWPAIQFDVNINTVYLNNKNDITGAHVLNAGCIPTGFISLYELNVDRDFSAQTYDPKTNPEGIKSKIFPFVTKDGSFEAIGNVSVKDYFNTFEYGDVITGSYPMSASLIRSGTAPGGQFVMALQNTLNYYTPVSPHYAFSSSIFQRDFGTDDVNLLNIPSIFYGSQLKKGTVRLKFYISGTLVAELNDRDFNGELIQVADDGETARASNNEVAGVVLYNEGIILLTGSAALTFETYEFGIGAPHAGRWLDFAAGANDGVDLVTPSASFSVNFEAINNVQTLTMFANAPKSNLNFSSNPTFLNHDSSLITQPVTSSVQYKESEETEIFNTVSSSFFNFDERFKHQTFISKIGIYDYQKNLIAVASLATPIKKNSERDFTFKLKLDL